MEETWKDIYFIENNIIYDYRGLYQVSNFGRIKSLGNHSGHNSKERILKGWKSEKGYVQIELRNRKCERKTFATHRIVAFMFIHNDNINKKTEVNHKDENKENNHVSNLEWCTTEYNCNYGTRNKRHGESIKGENHYASRKVVQYDKNMNLIKIWNCSMDVERDLGIFSSNIRKCCYGERKSAGGFIWKYVVEENNSELL